MDSFAVSGCTSSGNPAAVVCIPANTEVSAQAKCSIAAELNQPVTSFLTPIADNGYHYQLQWLTAAGMELPLCGHGTVAAAAAVLQGDVASVVRTMQWAQGAHTKCTSKM